MRKKGFITGLAALHALLLCALTLPAHAEWEDYQYETFDSTETIFPTGTFGEAAYSVDSQGRYIVNGMESSVDSLAAINDSNSFYRVSAECQILSSTAGELAFCGLMFHYGKRPGDDKPSYYVFYVYGDGFYGVKRIINGGKSDVIIPLANTELLAAGETNTLAVEARGNRFELFINGQPVNDFTDMKIDGGGYGLYISKHSIGAFDNFEVQLEPAPVRQQTDVQRSEGSRAIKPLSIPRNPDRPLYPWEVGYDKDPKKKKRKLEAEKRGDESSESRPADEPKAPAKKPTKKTEAKPKKAKPTAELKRDTTSRNTDKGFVADEAPPAPLAEVTSEEAPGGSSLRKQYKQSRREEPEPSSTREEDPIEDVAREVAEPTVEEALPEKSGGESGIESVELQDEPVTDTGEALPEPESSATEDLLYRRAPEFEEKEQDPVADEKPAETEPDKQASEKKPADKPAKRRRGINTGSDDWDSPRTAYNPKNRKPAKKVAEKPTEETQPAPAEAIASDGSRVKVETVPLDGGPLADTEIDQEAAIETSAPIEEDAAATLPEPIEEAAAEPTEEASAEPTEETVEAPMPSLDLPEVPAEKSEPPLKPKRLAKAGEVMLTDDFTSQQLWNTQDLPTSSYKYADGGYAINNVNAQTMAISYQQDTFADVDLAVDAAHSGGADYVGYGVAARFRLGKDASGRPVISYYGVFISRSGEFMLLKVVDGTETVLKDWGLSPLIDLGAVNRIELRVEGNKITALINGREAASVMDSDIASGGYALLAGPGISAAFDSLSLTGVRE